MYRFRTDPACFLKYFGEDGAPQTVEQFLKDYQGDLVVLKILVKSKR